MTTLYVKRGRRYHEVGVQLIQQSEQREVLIYAFRYALGRMTYSTMTMQHVITQAWPHLNDGTKALIRREIMQAEEDQMIGHECDRQGWLKLLELPE